MEQAGERFERVVGQRLQGLRVAYGLTREELAKLAGVSVDTIQRIEHGACSPSLETLECIASGLGLSLKTLFDIMETGERDFASELCDLVSRLPHNELYRVRRVFDALFNSAEGRANQAQLPSDLFQREDGEEPP